MEQKQYKLQSTLQEKASCVQALQDEAKVHGFPSSLVVRITELKSSLRDGKGVQDGHNHATTKMKSHDDDALKALQQEKESRAKDRQARGPK